MVKLCYNLQKCVVNRFETYVLGEVRGVVCEVYIILAPPKNVGQYYFQNKNTPLWYTQITQIIAGVTTLLSR